MRNRDAIDRMPAEADQRQSAIAEILAAAPMPLPSDPHDLRHELDEAHERAG